MSAQDSQQTKRKISDDTRLADLTVGEFRQMMKTMLRETVWEIQQSLPDPDEGLTLKPEFAEELRKIRDEGRNPDDYISHEEFMRQLGLSDDD